MKRTLIILTSLALFAGAGVALFIYSGLYNVGATLQHTAPVYWLLETAMRRAVHRRAQAIEVPLLTAPATIERGLNLYRTHCASCHGAPGVAPESFALGMMPVPANLALTAREWRPAELYWVVRHGVKTSGMPAWEFRLPDADLWAVIAFVATLPTLSPQMYQDRTGAIAKPPIAEPADLADDTDAAPQGSHLARGDAARGKIALQQYACVACHDIPGVVGANKPVGPSLAGITSRKYLAGVLPNTPGNMVRWLRFPQAIAPYSAMPDLDVTSRDARDMTMYLNTLE